MTLQNWDDAAPPPRPRKTVVVGTSLEGAVEGMMRSRRLATTTARVARWVLLGGRFKLFCDSHGITRAEDLSAELVETFLQGVEMRVKPVTASKYRQYFKWLFAHLRERGIEVGELGPGPRPDRRRVVEVEAPLSLEEARMLVQAAHPGRDRMIVELLLATGMRPSELCALRIDHVRLERTPPCVQIRGSVHDLERTKSQAGQRDVPLNTGGLPVAKHMRQYLDSQRPRTTSQALFLGTHRDREGQLTGLTMSGLGSVLDRLGERTGIHCNPYRFRHTVCSWLADAGLPEFQLMTLMGWSSARMVERYYRRRNQLALEAATRIRLV